MCSCKNYYRPPFTLYNIIRANQSPTTPNNDFYGVVSSKFRRDNSTFPVGNSIGIQLAVGLVSKEVCHNDRRVINNLLLLHPPCTGFGHACINSLCRSELTFDHFNSLLIVDELPKSICGNNEEFVCLGVEFVLTEFWL